MSAARLPGAPPGAAAEPPACPAEAEAARGAAPTPADVVWTPEAETRLGRAPVFLRGMVRRLAEKRARAEGVTVITPELMTRYKNEMMGLAARGDYAVPVESVPWTPEACALLDAVPEFMRPMTRRICEELATEQNAAEVTPALIRAAESQAEAEGVDAALPWTAEAEARLLARLGRTPAMMADFVLQLFKRDVEIEARRAGARTVTAEVLDRVWGAAEEERIRWTADAWARLQTAPEFVREGIRKAAERRARRMGVPEITSPLLTRFRNQAMMKAVKRIRELGFSALTFDAFDAAKTDIRTVSLNPEAQERLDRIRRYFEAERHAVPGDLLGHDLMQRFRRYLEESRLGPARHERRGPRPLRASDEELP